MAELRRELSVAETEPEAEQPDLMDLEATVEPPIVRRRSAEQAEAEEAMVLPEGTARFLRVLPDKEETILHLRELTVAVPMEPAARTAPRPEAVTVERAITDSAATAATALSGTAVMEREPEAAEAQISVTAEG